MIRPQYTLAMIAAAIGVPYTASETELGRSTLQTLRGRAAEVAPSVPSGDGINAHREVERILENDGSRYRYSSLPQSVAAHSPPGSTGYLGTAAYSPAAARPAHPAGHPAATGPAAAAISPPNAAGGAITAIPASSSGAAHALASNHMADAPPAAHSHAPGSGYQQALVGTRIDDLREVLRFDISPDWVTAKFSRVTTVLAELELEGLRVPIVTGIGVDDLAGSITYYFDRAGKLQRVMLHAFTGDASSVVATMTQHYGLQPEPSLDAGVYTRRWNGVPVHFLRLTRAPVVYSDALHSKLIVYLELNQPDLAYGISTEAERIIHSDQHTGRW